jgi:membrane protein
MPKIKKIFSALLGAANNVVNHDGIEHAGYLSFLVLFSIFPFIIFFLALTSLFGFSDPAVSFVKYIISVIPGEVIKSRIQELLKVPPQRLMTLAILGSIWTASSFVEGLRTILNRIHNIKSPPRYIFRRMLSIIQFLLISIFLFLVMMVLVVIPIIVNKFSGINAILDYVGIFWYYVRYIMIFACLFFASCSLYYIIPNVKINLKEVMPGAFLTTCLWLINGRLLSTYIGYYSQLNLIYGSLGNIIITMIFFYVSNIIFIYGAEFNCQIYQPTNVSI